MHHTLLEVHESTARSSSNSFELEEMTDASFKRSSTSVQTYMIPVSGNMHEPVYSEAD